MNNRWSRYINAVVCFISGIGLYACHTTEQRSTEADGLATPAFYHWKTTYNPTQWEVDRLNQLTVNKVYLHFFDVDWDPKMKQAVPKAFVRFAQKPAFNVVPVVFITNRTLQQLTFAGLPELAEHIAQAVRKTSERQGITLNEVQFDCDWSVGTRDRYFKLLTLLGKRINCPISATIRLHQIKYADKTGIPPVARGMLMLYNVADWKQMTTRNSIYDADVVAQYLPYVTTYRLPLDVVLPLFRWTVVYRNGRFLTFLNNIDQQTLLTKRFLLVQPDSNRFVAISDTSAFGFSIRRGDLFRAEAVTSGALQMAKNQLVRKLPHQSYTFALYHLDSLVLASYSRETLQTLIHPIP